jgi:hypothetical protein
MAQSALYQEHSKERFAKIEIYEGTTYHGTVSINGRKRFGLKQARDMMSHYSVLGDGLSYQLVEI